MKSSNAKSIIIVSLCNVICGYMPTFGADDHKTEIWDFSCNIANRAYSAKEYLTKYQGIITVSSKTQCIDHVEINLLECKLEKDPDKLGEMSVPKSKLKFNFSNEVWQIENPQQYERGDTITLAGITSIMMSVISMDSQQATLSDRSAWRWSNPPIKKDGTLLAENIIWKTKLCEKDRFFFEVKREVSCAKKTVNGYETRMIFALLPENTKLAYELVTNKVITAGNSFGHPSLSKSKQFGIVDAELSKRK